VFKKGTGFQGPVGPFFVREGEMRDMDELIAELWRVLVEILKALDEDPEEKSA